MNDDNLKEFLKTVDREKFKKLRDFLKKIPKPWPKIQTPSHYRCGCL